ncbi:hydrophobin [Gelatoporia subvermispora B]|uniref:Hydrophobin n=1 Tax=Ceriporiopsis subvermispora (strain B) TaxID=914234 RepID=M2QVM0_CERS8|nr:hydrophobin [Gelatoporia subvermispora B]
MSTFWILGSRTPSTTHLNLTRTMQLFAISALTALASLAAASPAAPSTCSTGTAMCCQQTGTAGSGLISELLMVLNIVVADLDTVVGVDCSGITVIGIGGSGSCDSNTICCDSTADGGLIGLGCLPIIL